MKKRSKNKTIVVSILLSLGCVAGGYIFYQQNPHDPWPAFIFGFGLIGILLSVLRNSK